MPRGGWTTEPTARRSRATSARRRSSGRPMFSRREVASFAGTSLQAIDKAIEQGVVPRARRRAETLISEDGLAVMLILGSANIELPVKVKQQVRRWVAKERPFAQAGDPALKLSETITVHVPAPLRERVAEAEAYATDRDRFIEHNPQIFGGQPIIRGTRIPVHTVAERLAAGDTIDILAEDYPHVERRALEVAERYALTHPRRGRPAKPWKSGRRRRTGRG